MNIRKTSVFYHVFTLTLSNIGLNLLGFLYRIFLSRMTGAEGMGVYQLIMPYYSVVLAICVTGLTMATSTLTAQHIALNDNAGARKVVSRALCVFFAMFSLVAAGVVSFSDFIASDVLGDARCRIPLLIILPCLFCTGIENILKNYFFGIQKLKPPITSELTEQGVRFIAVAALLIIFAPSDAGVSSALIICGMVISEIVSVFILIRFYGRRPAKSNAPVLREICTIAVPVALSALLNNALAAANSILIPQRLVTAGLSPDAAISEFGVLFGMTMPVLTLPFSLLAALTTVIIPTMSEKLARGNLSDLRRKAGKLLHTTSLLAFPAIGVLIPLGTPLCQLIYNNDAAGMYMLPLCIATLFSYYHMSLTALLNAIGRQRRAAVVSVLGGAIQLVGTWLVGVPHIGIYGFLAGDIISAVFSAALCLIPLVRHLKLRVNLRNWFVTPLTSAVLASLCARFLFTVANGDGISRTVSLLCALTSAAVIYLLALRVQGTSLVTYLKKLQS